MLVLGKEEMCIIGGFGLLDLLLKTIKKQLVVSIANLELNLSQFGAPSSNLLMRWIEIMKHMDLPRINVITANLEHCKIIKPLTLMQV